MNFELIKTLDGNFDYFLESLLFPQNICIVGKQRSGKTATICVLSDFFKAFKGNWYLDFPISKANLLPKYIHITEVIEEVPDNSFVVKDEGEDSFSSYGRMKNRLLLNRSKKRGWTILFECKNTRRLNVNILSDCDIMLIKEPARYQLDAERKWIRKIMLKAKSLFDEIPRKERREYLFIDSEEFSGLVKVKLVDWWTEELSKAWS